MVNDDERKAHDVDLVQSSVAACHRLKATVRNVIAANKLAEREQLMAALNGGGEERSLPYISRPRRLTALSAEKSKRHDAALDDLEERTHQFRVVPERLCGFVVLMFCIAVWYPHAAGLEEEDSLAIGLMVCVALSGVGVALLLIFPVASQQYANHDESCKE